MSLFCIFTLWSKKHLCRFVWMLSISDVPRVSLSSSLGLLLCLCSSITSGETSSPLLLVLSGVSCWPCIGPGTYTGTNYMRHKGEMRILQHPEHSLIITVKTLHPFQLPMNKFRETNVFSLLNFYLFSDHLCLKSLPLPTAALFCQLSISREDMRFMILFQINLLTFRTANGTGSCDTMSNFNSSWNEILQRTHTVSFISSSVPALVLGGVGKEKADWKIIWSLHIHVYIIWIILPFSVISTTKVSSSHTNNFLKFQ